VDSGRGREVFDAQFARAANLADRCSKLGGRRLRHGGGQASRDRASRAIAYTLGFSVTTYQLGQGGELSARIEEAPLKAILRHDGRLDVLCCLIDGAPLAVPQLSAMTGMPTSAVSHYVNLLCSFDLVAKVGCVDGEEPLYSATLDGHPDWVRAAIEGHRCRD
jgi:regulatory ArsR family protein